MTSGDLDLWDMVTKKNLYNPGCVIDICAENEVDPMIKRPKIIVTLLGVMSLDDHIMLKHLGKSRSVWKENQLSLN